MSFYTFFTIKNRDKLLSYVIYDDKNISVIKARMETSNSLTHSLDLQPRIFPPLPEAETGISQTYLGHLLFCKHILKTDGKETLTNTYPDVHTG